MQKKHWKILIFYYKTGIKENNTINFIYDRLTTNIIFNGELKVFPIRSGEHIRMLTLFTSIHHTTVRPS